VSHDVKRINLALQGGGAHGAFSWGVLDRLLADPGIEIAAISGTSAGALNGAALKAGMAAGGAEGARARLHWLWNQIGGVGDLRSTAWMMPMLPAWQSLSDRVDDLIPMSPAEWATRLFSPYGLGPWYRNPLAAIVGQLQLDHATAASGPVLFVSATNVRTGKIRVFSGAEIGTEAILASACLPTVFQAVEIADPVTGTTEAYWDGGYVGNPALFPLYDKGLPDDIVIVNINPIRRDTVPTTTNDIQNRINEVSFNASLLADLRAIAFVRKLLSQGAVAPGTMKNVLVHMIADDDLMNSLSVGSKLSASPALLQRLMEAGQAAADRFLTDHRGDLNVAATVDLAALYA